MLLRPTCTPDFVIETLAAPAGRGDQWPWPGSPPGWQYRGQTLDQGVSNLSKLVGASVWEERLYDHLTAHEQQEQEVLAEYQDAAAAAKSAAFAYLADLIVDDEIRHHKICGDLAAALKTDAELRPERARDSPTRRRPG